MAYSFDRIAHSVFGESVPGLDPGWNWFVENASNTTTTEKMARVGAEIQASTRTGSTQRLERAWTSGHCPIPSQGNP
jgi:hypothetical protein